MRGYQKRLVNPFTRDTPALGHKRTSAVQEGMSALPPKADMCGATGHVRFVPIAHIQESLSPKKPGTLAGIFLSSHFRNGRPKMSSHGVQSNR